MKTKVWLLCIVLLFILGDNTFAVPASERYTIQAQEAVEAGYITQSEYEIFCSELEVDVLEVDYGTPPIYAMYDLNVLGILSPDVEAGYALESRPTIVDGLKIIERLYGLEQNFPETSGSARYLKLAKVLDIADGAVLDSDYLNTPLSYEGFIKLMIKGLGYHADTDYKDQNMEQFGVDIGLLPYISYDTVFNKADMIEIVKSALDMKPKGSEETLMSLLVKKGVITQDAVTFHKNQLYERAFPRYRDLTSQVMWKYANLYDFVYFSNFRSGSAPVSKSYGWPDREDVELRNAGRIRIAKTSETEAYSVFNDILHDLGLESNAVVIAIDGLKTDGAYMYSEYLERVLNMYETDSYIHIGIYLEF